MSVFGLDFGNSSSVVAIARRGGVDVCINEVSKRTTPACVSFGDKERHIGEAGATLRGRNPKNTVVEVKKVLGKKFDDETVSGEIVRHPNRIESGPGGDVTYTVRYGYRGDESSDGEESFTATEIAAMLLTNLRDIAASENGGAVRDCVIAVPSYFTEHQRRALLDAAEIANVKVLRLVDETTAAALQYGIPKSKDFDEEKPTHVVFYDLGHSSLNVCVAAFTMGKVSVKASASEAIGGRDFDRVLFEHFADKFKAKSKCDVREAPRSSLRLLTAVEKTKKILSANPEAPCNVESLMNDIDFADKISRDEFMELASALKDRLLAPLHAALEEAGLKPEDVSTCELMGGSTRMPVVIKSLESVFGKEPSRTLNQDECVARGAAFIAAMLSPAFRVRDFAIEDIAPYAIAVAHDAASEGGEGGETVIVERGMKLPKASTLTFKRSADFDLRARYSSPEGLPKGTPQALASFRIKGVKPEEDGSPATIKVKVRLDVNGIFDIVSANVVQTVEVEETVEVKDDMDVDAEPAKMDEGGEAKDEEPKKAEEPAAPKTKTVTKTKTRLTAVQFEKETASMPAAALQASIEREGAMAAADKLVRDTADRRNAVESYVYEMRDKVSEGGSLASFIDPAVRESFVAQLTETEDWLYDDGEDASKSVYVAKLNELETIGNPVVRRYEESVRRPAAIAKLNEVCREHRVLAESTDAKYEHISAEDRATVTNECANATAWIAEMQAEIAAKPGHVDPAVTVRAIEEKATNVTAKCRPIMNKPKPKVTTTEINAPADDDKKDAADKDTGADADAAKDGENADAAKEGMDLD